jgi:hypothetical protein
MAFSKLIERKSGSRGIVKKFNATDVKYTAYIGNVP